MRRRTTGARRPGRPSKLTTARVLTLMVSLGEGLDRWEASRRAGIGRRTLQTWLAQGRRGEAAYTDLAAAIAIAERWGRSQTTAAAWQKMLGW